MNRPPLENKKFQLILGILTYLVILQLGFEFFNYYALFVPLYWPDFVEADHEEIIKFGPFEFLFFTDKRQCVSYNSIAVLVSIL